MSDANHSAENGLYRNWISILGTTLMVAALFGGTLIFVLEMAFDQSAPYLGLVYVACCAGIVLGFVLIPGGMLFERYRRASGHGRSTALSEFRLDFSRPEHRYGALSFVATGLLVLVLVGVGSYKSFHATESVEFCGQLCHTVMNPEWVRYQDSPHARVKCAECHIGSGADWFVKSKLSGLRQIWAVMVNSFPRPIPTPISDLRPARETCEQCHWRRKFTGYKELVRSYYLSDEENTLHQLRMLVKIGGEQTTFLKGAGIHYHMLIASEVEYVATDDKRQDIAWVRVSRGDGSVTEYNNTENAITEEERAAYEVRKMDCMDCHNRPAHRFPTPMQSVNDAIADGSISLELPFIKLRAVKALDVTYATTEEAQVGIANEMRHFYRTEYPAVFEQKNARLTETIRRVQRIYRETVFPEMKAMWSAYPDNIGHRDSPGCFRCHSDSMESGLGETIFTDCTRCHLILAQGESITQVNVDIEKGLPFIHPDDLEDIEEFTLCTDCHDGGASLYD